MIIDFHAEDTAIFTFEHRCYRGNTAGYGPTPVLMTAAFVVNSNDCWLTSPEFQMSAARRPTLPPPRCHSPHTESLLPSLLSYYRERGAAFRDDRASKVFWCSTCSRSAAHRSSLIKLHLKVLSPRTPCENNPHMVIYDLWSTLIPWSALMNKTLLLFFPFLSLLFIYIFIFGGGKKEMTSWDVSWFFLGQQL